ncbi:MAG: PSD1 and planctomycete cytochrome C domain-containing protein, partial [Planctomycetota bacterium]
GRWMWRADITDPAGVTVEHSMNMLRIAAGRLSAWFIGVQMAVGSACSGSHPPGAPDFERDVAPILVRRCLECHSSHNPSGHLSLDNARGLQTGGDSGAVINATRLVDSLLLHRVSEGEMPPLKHGDSQKLPDAEIAVIKSWVSSGASFPEDRTLDLYERTTDVRGGRDWWSFQPMVASNPPNERTDDRVNPIDAFVRRTLKEKQLSPAPQASTQTLVRRLYWDITGLPAPADAANHLDLALRTNPNAWNELVNTLLESPHFGERWARHWLDVARYAETCGYERDQVKPAAWRYRDWVVQAINSDMPYDQFIREQLAGDEIPNRTEQSVIGTGFLCLGTWNDEPNDPEDYKYERLEDLVHTTATAFLGLTVKCARCHDHKFDPIPQVDYYRLAAAFWPGPIQPRRSELLGGPTPEELGFVNVLGWTDITTSPVTLHVLKNGERAHPLQPVNAASLSFLPAEFREFQTRDRQRTTGLRLQLANWIASPHNPLTARVIVNRLWHHHFGQGLVRSTNNFGFTGDRPTHPELLDWLAAELIRNAWSLKSIHRLILTSETWKQSSIHPKQVLYERVDAGNSWLWRANRRRADAESLRDAFLSATGELDLTLGGPSFFPAISEDALEGLSRKGAAWTASPESEQHRRSLYIFTQRSLLPPLMTTFDLCDSTMSCGQRDVTIVAPQALTLLNNEFVHARAETLATSVLGSDSSTKNVTDHHIARSVWKSILKRDPHDRELQAAVEHVARQHARFAGTQTESEPAAANPDFDAIAAEAVLMLDASRGVQVSETGHVEYWADQSVHSHHARQLNMMQRPTLVENSIHGQPVIRFNGSDQFMTLDGQLLDSDHATVFAVVTDHASEGQLNHRELISNWSGRDGNSVSSFFVGLTGEKSIRFSDSMSGVGQIISRDKPFLLTATNGEQGAMVFQQHRAVARAGNQLPARRLDTPWVIAQQGNIDGEYWNGDVAFLMVINRQTSDEERIRVQTSLMTRFNLPEVSDSYREPASPKALAVASLCLVLFNSNEFVFID